jgi:predicted metal-dependent hydrolase
MGAVLHELCDVRGSELRKVHVSLAVTARQKLLSKRDIIQQGGFRQTALPQKVALVIVDESLSAVSGFWGLGGCQPNLAQHRQKAMQRRRFASMNRPRITLQKSINCGFINLLQVKLRNLEPLAEPGDRIHLHWNRRRQKALLLNTFQISIKMRGQWPHAKPVEKAGTATGVTKVVRGTVEQAKEGMREEIRHWAAKLRVSPRRVQIQRMTTKWASCSTNGRVCFSLELLNEPASFREVVIVHELLHLLVPNHGKLFKSLMNAYVPGWEARVAGRVSRLCGTSGALQSE